MGGEICPALWSHDDCLARLGQIGHQSGRRFRPVLGVDVELQQSVDLVQCGPGYPDQARAASLRRFASIASST